MTCVELLGCMAAIVGFVIGVGAGWHKWHSILGGIGGGMLGTVSGLFIAYILVVITGLTAIAMAWLQGDKSVFEEPEPPVHDGQES